MSTQETRNETKGAQAAAIARADIAYSGAYSSMSKTMRALRILHNFAQATAKRVPDSVEAHSSATMLECLNSMLQSTCVCVEKLTQSALKTAMLQQMIDDSVT